MSLLSDLRALRDEADDKADTTDTDHPNFAMRVATLLDRVIARMEREASRLDAEMRLEDIGIEQARKDGRL